MEYPEDNAFSSRLARYGDELKRLYLDLYHSDQQAYEYFTQMLRRAWEERRQGLRELDEKRVRRAELSREVGELQTSPTAVERVAREKYNLVRDGETVLTFPEPPDPRQRPEERREKP